MGHITAILARLNFSLVEKKKKNFKKKRKRKEEEEVRKKLHLSPNYYTFCNVFLKLKNL